MGMTYKTDFLSNWAEKSALLSLNSFSTSLEKMTRAQDKSKADTYTMNRDRTGGCCLRACGAVVSEKLVCPDDI